MQNKPSKFVAHYLGSEKQSQCVQDHLEETSSLADTFSSKIGLASLGKLTGLLHDFGKYSTCFQKYIRSSEGIIDPDFKPSNNNPNDKPDHSTAGAQLAWQELKDKDKLSKFCAQLISLSVASHHSGLIDCLSPDGEDKFSLRMVKNDKDTHLNEVRTSVDSHVLEKISRLFQSSDITGEMTDYLKRLFREEPSREVREFYIGLTARFLFSALIDADRLSSAGRYLNYNTGYSNWNVLVDRMEKHLQTIKANNKIDIIRSQVSNACRESAFRPKGLYQLTVPTGGGKTLSSLRFGIHHAEYHHMDRLIYVIPYLSIIDQNAAVARSIFEEKYSNELVVLEHHSNLVPEQDTTETRLLSENWDAQIIFTTNVQFLETLFGSGTRAARRMHQLTNAVIIFDEVQNIPIKAIHMFNNAVNYLVKSCGSTIVFCTATQPLLDRVESNKGAARFSEGSQLVPQTQKLFGELRRVEVVDVRKSGGWTDDEIADCLCNEAKESGSGLVIVNTKAKARSIYELCRRQINNVYHLSTNMCPAHRLENIDRIKHDLANKTRLEPVVCVSTQLIEAGVDIDFGSVVRCMAGLESIGQAAGRCNRNGSRPTGKVLIVNSASENIDKLLDICVAQTEASRVLDEYHDNPAAFSYDLIGLEAIRRYYEYYFFNRKHEMGYPASAKEIGHDDNLLSLLSTNSLAVAAYSRKQAPPISLRQSFKTAGSVFKVIDAPTEGIIVPYGDKGKEIIGKLCATDDPVVALRLLRDAQRYSVNLFPQDKEKLAEKGVLNETRKGSGVLYLDERYYDPNLGVVLETNELMEFKNG